MNFILHNYADDILRGHVTYTVCPFYSLKCIFKEVKVYISNNNVLTAIHSHKVLIEVDSIHSEEGKKTFYWALISGVK